MFTATRDVMLPTTMTGSWPRPSWYREGLWGQPFEAKMNDLTFREQFSDAVATLISDLEQTGMDILTNGDYHHDPDLAGRSWCTYPWERLNGVEKPGLGTASALTYPPGTLIGEIMTSWRFPTIIDEVSEGTPLAYGDIWRVAQDRTTRPVKFGAISAQTVTLMTSISTDKYKEDKRDLMWRLAEIFNAELRRLAAAGCKVIQLEEALIHIAAQEGDPGYLSFLVDCLNREIEGLEDVEVWVHTCWGNPNMQRVVDNTDYAAGLRYYMENVNCDVWTVEAKDNPHSIEDLFQPYKGNWPVGKKIAIGGVSHRTFQVETPAEVAAQIRTALKVIPPENLIISTDCGFGRQGVNRSVAFYKCVSLVMGTNIVRHELGFPATHVPAAEPGTGAGRDAGS